MFRARRALPAFALIILGFAFAPALAQAAEEAPTITSISPTEGGSAGGTKVIIKGTSFTGALTTGGVHFGAAALKKITTGTLARDQFKVKSATEIEADSPILEHNTVAVTVTNSGGTSAETAAAKFTYLPEFFRNEQAIGSTAKNPIVGYGELTLQTPLVENTEHFQYREVEIECVNLFYGFVDDEGEPVHSKGAILEWWAMGHTPVVEHSEVSPLCRFAYDGGPGGEAWVTAERPLHAISQKGEVCIEPNKELGECPKKVGEVGDERRIITVVEQLSREELTPPWNTELYLNSEREPHLRIGVPTETGKSCSEEPAPPGCVRLTIIYPALDLFFPFEGSIEPRWANGAGSGLTPSSLEFEGEGTGHIHAAGNAESVLNIKGGVKVIGATQGELLTVR